MNFKGNVGFLGALACFLLVIFDSRTALAGARVGLELCLRTVIPSLLPLFFLSGVITSSLAAGPGPVLRGAARFLGIPAQACGVLIPGFLGGYPMGAAALEDLYRQGTISYGTASRMLAFCSNPGPAFLFGMVSAFFPEAGAVWLLWGIVVLSAVLTALCLPGAPEGSNTPQSPGFPGKKPLQASVEAIAAVCGWVILLRTLLAFPQRWLFPHLSTEARVILTGIAELANGCCALDAIADLRVRFVLCGCMLSFGGICVLCQTASAAPSLPISRYLLGKLCQTLFTFLLCCGLVMEHGIFYLAFAAVFVPVLRKMQNRDSIPGKIPV